MKKQWQEMQTALVDRWTVLGPCKESTQFSDFHGDHEQFLLDPNATLEGLDGAIRWQDWNFDAEAPEMPDLASVIDVKGASVAFLATFVFSRKDQTAQFVLHSDNDLTGIINETGISFDKDGSNHSAQINLRHGWNILVIRINLNVPEAFPFAGSLFDASGQRTSEIFFKGAFMKNENTDSHMFGKNPNDACTAIELGDPKKEHNRTNPDVVMYVPREGDDYNDGDNEHVLVVESPKSQTLLAMWTQGTMEPFGDNHTMLSRSSDGIHWSEPEWVVGTHKGTHETQASWGFPVVSKSGRLYCFYTKSSQGLLGGCTATMGGLYSDDEGRSWTEGPDIKIPACFEDPNDLNSKEIGGFIVWQNAFTDRHGRTLLGFTRFKFGTPKGEGSCGHVMRLENIDDGPDIEDLQISWLTVEGNPIAMPENQHCSEPSFVLLPDGRLFATVRTMTGHIWYSISEDDGCTWTEAEVLRYEDDGEKIKNPLTCCPIYPLPSGKFLLLYVNNSYSADLLAAGKELPAGMSIFSHRRPACTSVGEFKPDAKQPIWFSQPKELMDNKGISLSAKGTNELATYTSITNFNGKLTLWYPERKYYLLGKFINEADL